MIQCNFLVAGATQGVGLAISKRLSAAGHEIVGIAPDPVPFFPRIRVSIDRSEMNASVLVTMARIPARNRQQQCRGRGRRDTASPMRSFG